MTKKNKPDYEPMPDRIAVKIAGAAFSAAVHVISPDFSIADRREIVRHLKGRIDNMLDNLNNNLISQLSSNSANKDYKKHAKKIIGVR